MEKKKNAQCEFCSPTDFGGESAENKAASVQLPQRGFLVAPQVFIKLLSKKGDASGSPLTLSLKALVLGERWRVQADVRGTMRPKGAGRVSGRANQVRTSHRGASGLSVGWHTPRGGEPARCRPHVAACTLHSHVLWINICKTQSRAAGMSNMQFLLLRCTGVRPLRAWRVSAKKRYLCIHSKARPDDQIRAGMRNVAGLPTRRQAPAHAAAHTASRTVDQRCE